MTFDKNNFKLFDGALIHPSLEVRDKILALGFRCRIKHNKEGEVFIVVRQDIIDVVDTDFFLVDGKTYWFDKRNRKLASIDDRWNLTELTQFITDYEKLRLAPTSSKSVFEEIIELAKRYIELEQEIDYQLLAAWIIGTYFHRCFYAYPFLHVKAPKRSGKSQCLNFLLQTCFNAIKARPSLAAMSDTVDALRGTYLIDQADNLERKGNEELLDILADSYKKNGGKRRVVNFDKKRGRESLEFETYSPKAFASIKDLPEDLRDRCLVVPLIRSKKNFADPDDENQNWKSVRTKLYKFLIGNYDVVEMAYNVKKIKYRQNNEILGRSLELWLPFEIIFEACQFQEKIEEGKKRFLSQYGFTEYEPSEIEEMTIRAILGKLESEPEVIMTPKEISELMGIGLFSPGETPKQRAAKVGWALKKFNLPSEKKSRTNEGMRYVFKREKVKSIYDSYFKSASEPTLLTQEAFIPVNPEQNGVQDLSVSPESKKDSYTPTLTSEIPSILGRKDDSAGSVSENQNNKPALPL